MVGKYQSPAVICSLILLWKFSDFFMITWGGGGGGGELINSLKIAYRSQGVIQENDLGVARGKHSTPNAIEVSLIQLGNLARGCCKSSTSGDVRGQGPLTLFLAF